MVEDLMHALTHVQNCTVKLVVYSSYSPCMHCAESLISFIAWLKAKNVRLRATIKFSNFYKIFQLENPNFNSDNATENCHWEGLKTLQTEVTLKTFDGKSDWEEFLEFVRMPEEDRAICMEVVCSRERREREKDDLYLLFKLREAIIPAPV